MAAQRSVKPCLMAVRGSSPGAPTTVTDSIRIYMKEKLTGVDFRNYAHDLLGIDCGTLSGIDEYIEWLEEIVCDDVKLKEVTDRINAQNEWFGSK